MKLKLNGEQLILVKKVKDISPILAEYVEHSFKLGLTQREIWERLEKARNATLPTE